MESFPRDPELQKQVMYEAQCRTNELLEQLIKLHTNTTVIQPKNKQIPDKPTRQRGKAQ